MYHQPHNTFGSKIFNAYTYENFEYEFHFHKSFELIMCMNAKVSVYIADEIVELSKGEFTLIFPYTKHKFSVSGEQKIWVGVFSGDYVPELEIIAKKKRPKPNKYLIPSAATEYINIFITNFERLPSGNRLSFSQEMSVRAAIYVFTDILTRSAVFIDESSASDLSIEIIRYIENNYTSEITLKTAADSLGYNYQYISRVFRKTLGMSFRSLINQYRFDNACRLLEKDGVTVTRAALDSGFQSIRNFNRVYHEKTGVSPRIDKETMR